jgi:hypothetical protein
MTTIVHLTLTKKYIAHGDESYDYNQKVRTTIPHFLKNICNFLKNYLEISIQGLWNNKWIIVKLQA